ncbi:phenylalanine--tRNA ligase subunit beta [Carboxydothermus hydrogenoformans]|uniref:Phenylalanine--tRNA ligase beta subunit n=1 Tax=Carboxydothermus hydrogenoformans (strain ATCC BAA-161 / DSM 6008 / Z-2901) TaxID=246194 RepID=SYFB_CARHZ|nr:phenylalanine--tRNA ligase subunit beta [Carboxydothermus hydrogenoformans]Q3ABT5.1 RecName: Full=Phenylalanine--tRNA ligase beta subunit; AltName: Full=Phenylalanyl-tRNA synthetase beta subunit; Short=PheRS [Carboxydothermus hydrogenoformans Z-2901]ABB16138.1 phenylalanyl-tRNA synthetase, beta subunit [Carboxydothermus hydrogenoformans Z-2901]
MNISYNWLQEFCEIPYTAQELGEKLTSVGIAVEKVTYIGNYEKVVVGEVLEVENLPGTELFKTKVSTGKEIFEVVTGAKNVFAGFKYPFALPGAKLPNGITIEERRIRGVVSQGMLLSAEELGLLERKGAEPGLMLLPPEAPVGEKIEKVLELDDYLLELDLTPNRGDCLSVLGVAREVAALTGHRLKLAEPELPLDNGSCPVSIEIQNPELCGRYMGIVIKNVKVGPSPLWLEQRLRKAGIRPINNIVDVTNYILLEYGQPLHAFDLDKLASPEIIVRNARAGEKITTLDGVERELTSEMLVIADREKPIAVAGIMGGQNTEVDDDTKTVFIEAAWFNPVSVRKTARKLGLRTDASQRFEKNVDIEGIKRALIKAALMICELAGGTIQGRYGDVYPKKFTPKVIAVSLSRAEEFLGISLDAKRVVEILESLGFRVTIGEKKIFVEVPSYRPDVSLEADIYEEIARYLGYNNFPDTMPIGITTTGFSPEYNFEYKVKNLLTALGMQEIITYSFINPDSYNKLGLSVDEVLTKSVVLLNPLSIEQSVMRTTLLPGLLDIAKRNENRQQENLLLFEMGNVFEKNGEDLPKETKLIGGIALGYRYGDWYNKPRKYDFYYVKGILESLFTSLGINNFSFSAAKDLPFLHPGKAARVYLENTEIGYLGELHPLVQKKYEFKNTPLVFELNYDLLKTLIPAEKKYTPLSPYPEVKRDIALLVEREIPAATFIEVIKGLAINTLKNIEIFDVYEGEKLGPNKKSIAISLTFSSTEKTLSEEEINNFMAQVLKALEAKTGAKLRTF